MNIEQYENGELVNTITLLAYTTATMEKNSIVHLIFNVGQGDVKSIYSLAEVDAEKTTDTKSPEYKVTKMNEASYDFDARTEVKQYGGELGQDVVLAGYVKFKEGVIKEVIDLATYKENVANYAAANIVKVNIVQK